MAKNETLVGLPYLFIAYRKNDSEWLPLCARMIAGTVTDAAKKLGLVHTAELGLATRYHEHTRGKRPR